MHTWLGATRTRSPTAGAAARERHRRVVLGQRDDPGVGKVGEPPVPVAQAARSAASTLLPGVEHDPVAAAADHRGDGGERDVREVRTAQLDLLGVAGRRTRRGAAR